jgi:hypothetical protein
MKSKKSFAILAVLLTIILTSCASNQEADNQAQKAQLIDSACGSADRALTEMWSENPIKTRMEFSQFFSELAQLDPQYLDLVQAAKSIETVISIIPDSPYRDPIYQGGYGIFYNSVSEYLLWLLKKPEFQSTLNNYTSGRDLITGFCGN